MSCVDLLGIWDVTAFPLLPSPFDLQSSCFILFIVLFIYCFISWLWSYIKISTCSPISMQSRLPCSFRTGAGKGLALIYFGFCRTCMDSVHFAWHLHVHTRILAHPVTSVFLLEQPWTPGSQTADCIPPERRPTEKGKAGKTCHQGSRSIFLHCLTFIFISLLCVYGHKAHKGFKAMTKERIYCLLWTCSWARRRMRSEDVPPDALWYS